MRLNRLLLRFYPPGIFLEYVQSGQLKTKTVDLLDVDSETDLGALVDEIAAKEPLITQRTKPKLLKVLERACHSSARTAGCTDSPCRKPGCRLTRLLFTSQFFKTSSHTQWSPTSSCSRW